MFRLVNLLLNLPIILTFCYFCRIGKKVHMKSFSDLRNITGWIVFAIATTVYALTAEPTGSLWDCGEFITGAYKLEVVHPPGAPLFMLIGRMFTFVADALFEDPAMIAYSINLLSGICTAFLAMFVCWSTIRLSSLAMTGRNEELDQGQGYAALGSGLVAGLATTFCSSVWFSAVEGEVYAMSSFFTGLVVWAVVKWFTIPDTKDSDRWLIFALFMVALSIGVHLLSLLTIPAFSLLYYIKKTEEPTFKGIALSLIAGVAIFAIGIQFLLIKLIPKIAQGFDYFFVNSLGMPFNSGLVVYFLLLFAVVAFGIYYAHKNQQALAQKLLVCFAMLLFGFSTYGVIIIRANANTPINMNNPSDAFSLIPYLNREQYGSRDLLKGPHFEARPESVKKTKKYGRKGDRYEVIDEKLSYVFRSEDKMLFPRMGDYNDPRPAQYKRWMGLSDSKPLPPGRPSQMDNISFFVNYQLKWMYWRYFMWNFSGRQNGSQGYYSSDVKNGNWVSGIGFIDNMRLYNMSEVPESMAEHEAWNKYYMLPFIFGLIGMFFHFRKRKYDALAVLVLFFMTGIAIVIYSNQPPNEPRERDYVLAASFFTYCMWIGMAVPAFYEIFKKYIAGAAAPVATALVLIAPLLMGTQNWDDHSRAKHTGARDYATNFLESCAKDAIVFTHGDNDTYPLWYAQEVENIRTDVRVVNLSLLAVDWYIDQLQRKTNESPAIKMMMDPEDYRGNIRNSLLHNPIDGDKPLDIRQVVKFMSEDHPFQLQGGETTPSCIPTKNMVITVDKKKVMSNGTITEVDTGQVVDYIAFNTDNIHWYDNGRIRQENEIRRKKGQKLMPLKEKSRFIKDELAMLDIIASNIWDRPIYYAVTCRPEKLLGLHNYLQLEGLALRIVPKRTSGDMSYGDMPIGQGAVHTDLMYDNVMNKFKWGGFDEHDMFVDHSYMPSVTSVRFAMLRLSQALIAEGDKKRATEVIEKYFKSFPHKNFPYDFNAWYMISELDEMGAYDNAKTHIKILAKETVDHLRFYNTLSFEDREGAFKSDMQRSQRIMVEVLAVIQKPGYSDIKAEMEAMFAPYSSSLPPMPTDENVEPIDD